MQSGKAVADLDASHGVTLVQHTQTGRIYAEKTLTVYQTEIFRQLKENPVPNTPRIYELEGNGVRL